MVCQSAPPASSPAPRLRARSMLSLGTEFFLAFWMASYSVGLPAGSPPPTRAATSMFLISRAKFLPRRASITAFLCFVVAHLEWPLMQVLLTSWKSCSNIRSTSLRGHLWPTERLQAAQRDDAVADTGRPADVGLNMHLNSGGGARGIVGEHRGGVDDGSGISGRAQHYRGAERRIAESGARVRQAVRDEERCLKRRMADA